MRDAHFIAALGKPLEYPSKPYSRISGLLAELLVGDKPGSCPVVAGVGNYEGYQAFSLGPFRWHSGSQHPVKVVAHYAAACRCSSSWAPMCWANAGGIAWASSSRFIQSMPIARRRSA